MFVLLEKGWAKQKAVTWAGAWGCLLEGETSHGEVMDLGDRSQHPEKLVAELLHHTKPCWYREWGRKGHCNTETVWWGYGAAWRSRTEGH